MKKLIATLMLFVIIFSCSACNYGSSHDDSAPSDESQNDIQEEEKDIYDSICTQLKRTSMGATVYSQAQIDEFEVRFTKMNLTAGFAKVNHFRSTSEYAYVIVFENPEDAQTFFDKIGTANYNVKKFDSVVVYGKSSSIDTLK